MWPLRLGLAEYGPIHAKLRTRLSKILTEQKLIGLLRAETAAEVAGMLEGTEYREAASVVAETGNIRRAEALLYETEVRFFGEIAEQVSGPPGDFVAAMICRYEVETLKRALRLWFEKQVKRRHITDEADYNESSRQYYR